MLKILKPKNYRTITAQESAVVQGFPYNFIFHSSDTQTKRLLGNAVSPPVVESLAKSIINTGVLDSMNLEMISWIMMILKLVVEKNMKQTMNG